MGNASLLCHPGIIGKADVADKNRRLQEKRHCQYFHTVFKSDICSGSAPVPAVLLS